VVLGLNVEPLIRWKATALLVPVAVCTVICGRSRSRLAPW
jgi:hypothetical protein